MYIFFDRCDLGIDNNENGYRVVAIFIGDIRRFYYLVKILSALRKILCKKKSNQTLPVNRAD